MPVIPSDARPEVFKHLSYMVEVFWLEARVHQRDGCLVFQSTGASNVSRQYIDMEVFFVPGMKASQILVNARYGDALGLVRNVPAYQRSLLYPSIRAFLKNVYPASPHWHAWCGYSMDTFTADDRYFACDWYWQDPSMVYSGRYHWYVLRDVADPVDWYLGGHQVLIKQYRTMDDGDVAARL